MTAPGTPFVRLLALPLSFLLAGCLSSGDGAPPDPVTPKPHLSDFADCDWTYPDGSPIACEPEAQSLRVDPPGAPPGWVCVERSLGTPPTWALYRGPLSEYGLAYNVDQPPTPIGGVIHVATPQEERLFNWSGGAASGFVRFPLGPQAEAAVSLVLFHANSTTNTTQLHGRSLDQLWSWRDNSFFPLHRLSVADQRYYFLSMFAVRGPEGEVTYKPSSAIYSGEDFDLRVGFVQHASAEFSVTLSSATVC